MTRAPAGGATSDAEYFAEAWCDHGCSVEADPVEQAVALLTCTEETTLAERQLDEGQTTENQEKEPIMNNVTDTLAETTDSTEVPREEGALYFTVESITEGDLWIRAWRKEGHGWDVTVEYLGDWNEWRIAAQFNDDNIGHVEPAHVEAFYAAYSRAAEVMAQLNDEHPLTELLRAQETHRQVLAAALNALAEAPSGRAS